MESKDFKIKRTVREYKKNINKYGEVHPKQIKFAEQITDLFYNDTNKDIVNVLIARCGMGKTEITKALLDNLVNSYTWIGTPPSREDILEDYGAIVITDSIERLEGISKSEGLEDRCYLMKFDNDNDLEINCRMDFKSKMKEQFKYPILLMTTQRYFKMSEKEREFMYTWAKGSREICIIDEKPILYNETVVDEKFLSEIRIAIHNCFEDEDKNYLLDTFDKIYSDLDYIRKNYSSNYETMWLKKSKKTLLFSTDDDDKFFDILSKKVSRVVYNNVLELKRIYTDGCLFISKKCKEQDNIRQFILLNDNSNKFDTEKCKYHILDATAKNDIDYKINKELFKYIEVDDKKENQDINIHHITFGASQNRLKKDYKAIEVICKWINDNFDEEVLISTYGKKSGIYQQFQNYLKTKKNIAYYGAIKGKNDWQNSTEMVHIGFNRQSDVAYLLTYIYLKKKYNDWNDMDNEDIKKDIDMLLNMEKGMFSDIYMKVIMRSKILVDTEQNIMRIKCRHFSNTEICNIFIVAGEYYNFFGNSYITMLKDKLNAKLFSYLPNDFAEYKILNRDTKDGNETIPQKILNWINNSWDGSDIKTKDMLNSIGITQKQFDKAKEKNNDLKEILSKYLIKRGIYKKVS